MRKVCNKAVNRLVTKALTLLGICSSAFVFMACYGPTPKGYAVSDEEDSLVVVTEEGDTVRIALDSEEIAEEPVSETPAAE